MALRNSLNRIERASGLDRLSDSLQRRVQGVVSRRVHDALHGVWLGHPLHPVLVMVPIGTWLSAAVLDTVRDESRAAKVLVGVGTAAAAPAAAAGINDWSSLSREQRRVGLLHWAGNFVTVWLYAASFAARHRGRHGTGRLLGYAGLAVAGGSAYVGGQLSYREAAGVNQAEPLLREIPEGWHDVCAVRDLSPGEPVQARIGEVPLLVTRGGDGDVTVMIERCSHETGPLGSGEHVTIDGDDCIVCPWHGSTFRLSDGAAVHGPAATGQPLLRARTENGRVLAALP